MRRRCRKNEHGQAVAELVVGLFGMLCIILGLLAFSALGISGIKNLIAARKGAEQNMAWGSGGDTQARHIEEWTRIRQGDGDGIQFTYDDEAVVGAVPSADPFIKNLVSSDGAFSTAYLDSTNYASGAFQSKFEDSNLFVSAAGLTSKREVVRDPLGLYKTFDLKRMMESFYFKTDFKIEDNVFMPMQQQDNY